MNSLLLGLLQQFFYLLFFLLLLFDLPLPKSLFILPLLLRHHALLHWILHLFVGLQQLSPTLLPLSHLVALICLWLPRVKEPIYIDYFLLASLPLGCSTICVAQTFAICWWSWVKSTQGGVTLDAHILLLLLPHQLKLFFF